VGGSKSHSEKDQYKLGGNRLQGKIESMRVLGGNTRVMARAIGGAIFKRSLNHFLSKELRKCPVRYEAATIIPQNFQEKSGAQLRQPKTAGRFHSR